MINKFLPNLEKFLIPEQQYIEYFQVRGEKDILGRVISNMKGIVELQASQGVDGWLGYGVYLPVVDYIFSQHKGESEADFFTRTQYPNELVKAYLIEQHPIATLIAADKYNRIHQQQKPVNTTVWELNDDGLTLNLADYPERLHAKI